MKQKTISNNSASECLTKKERKKTMKTFKKDNEITDYNKYPMFIISENEKLVYINDNSTKIFGNFQSKATLYNYLFNNTQILYLINELKISGNFFRESFPFRKKDGTTQNASVFGKIISKKKGVYVLLFHFNLNMLPDELFKFINDCSNINKDFCDFLNKYVKSESINSNTSFCSSNLILDFNEQINGMNFYEIFVCNFILEYYSVKDISNMIQKNFNFIYQIIKKASRIYSIRLTKEVLRAIYDNQQCFNISELFKYDSNVWRIVLF